MSNKINKCNKLIGIMKKLPLILSRKILLKIYESFVRPNLELGPSRSPSKLK